MDLTMDLVMQPDGRLGFDTSAFKVTFNLFILLYAIMCAHTQSCGVPEPPTSSVFGVPEPEGFVTIGADSLCDVSKVGSYSVNIFSTIECAHCVRSTLPLCWFRKK